MLGKFRRCETDEDFAKFTLFFIRHRREFHPHFYLNTTLQHIMETIQHARIILIEDLQDNVIGWAHYHYYSDDYQSDPNGTIAFVDSIIISADYRSSRLFFQGFRHFVHHISCENAAVQSFQFCALEDNVYLNRLYSKFARPIGKREGYNGLENVFSTEFGKLLTYLNRSNTTN